MREFYSTLLFKCRTSNHLNYGFYRKVPESRCFSDNKLLLCSNNLGYTSRVCKYNFPVSKISLASFESVRLYSDGSKLNKLKLMDFEQIVMPSFIKTFKMWIFSMFIIKPYFDKDFSLPEFIKGAKYALVAVSKNLSMGNFQQLEGLLSQNCLEEIKRNINTLNVAQRQSLAINEEDIYFSFPYELGVIFDESEDKSVNQKRAVEITMVFHVLQGFKEMTKQGFNPPIMMGAESEFRDKIVICNYRFIRNYTKGVSDQWTINIINHFKPSELME